MESVTHLYEKNKVKMVLLLIVAKELLPEELSKLESRLFTKSSAIIPLKNADDMRILLEKEEVWFNYKIPKKVIVRIIGLSGGHAGLCRMLLSLANLSHKDFIKLNDKDILHNPNVHLVLKDVFDTLQESSQDQIKKFMLNNNCNDFSDYVIGTEIIRKNGKNYKLFSTLFEMYIKELLQDNFEISNSDNGLLRLNVPFSEILSNQEEIVFGVLYENRGKIVSKEEIAKALWGEFWTEKYSDYLLDKLISLIRKKLILSTSTLKSIKGKGFILNIPQ